MPSWDNQRCWGHCMFYLHTWKLQCSSPTVRVLGSLVCSPHSNSSSILEQPCPVGSSANGFGLTNCTACAPGSFVAIPGQRSRICCFCEALYSFFSFPLVVACQPCPQGERFFGARAPYIIIQNRRFLVLSIGTAANSAGADQCVPCARGRFANSTGLQECTVTH
jgi:hypothetical protein